LWQVVGEFWVAGPSLEGGQVAVLPLTWHQLAT
jgi:hypothetical protein